MPARRVLLQQYEQDLPRKLILHGSGQVVSRLLLQSWLQKHDRQDRAGVLRGLSGKLVLYGERRGGVLHYERGGPHSIYRFQEMLLRVGLQRREQHPLCLLPIPYILLWRCGGTMQRGDLQRAALVESTELLLHPWTLGTLRLVCVSKIETLIKRDTHLLKSVKGA